MLSSQLFISEVDTMTYAIYVILQLVISVILTYNSLPDTAFNLLTRTRRSVMKYSSKAPAKKVERALIAATHAPNHWLNEPWRFRIIGKETIAKLSAKNPAKSEVFEQVPEMLIASCVLTEMTGEGKWNMKSLEDHAGKPTEESEVRDASSKRASERSERGAE